MSFGDEPNVAPPDVGKLGEEVLVVGYPEGTPVSCIPIRAAGP